MLTKETIEKEFQKIQQHICSELEKADGKATFKTDEWKRPEGGGGKSNILTGGAVIEKGGVNFSAVHGPTPDNILKALNLPQADFYATGVSIVMHTTNPWVPIIHMNIRYFEMTNGTWWFGGGIDLTPHYVVKEEAIAFHQSLKDVCDQFHETFYSTFKEWADKYFYIKHRGESRGVGGIFFDRMGSDAAISKEKLFEFVCALGYLFPKVYTKIIAENKSKSFTEEERNWQKLRRGRYVEFNLVYDRGTKFGLDTNGRIESILMSLPPEANWTYDFQPAAGSKEAETIDWLKAQPNWLAI
ncbi:oxygen-dependent coproporphyrinogen oxidase [Cytophaga aurantiaca]|uniref:oxygen-dependent coproporphyrinogen oxidase n=1 Tax=Cytophaga aurantiaca TaxID=29530 RepID=UPI00036DC559|nr:oxygen-dependent coproporphyrinogen oxidase [Cytophaga aurantiaca]